MRFPIATLAALALAGSALVASAARGQAAGEAFTATASVKSEAKSGTAPVRIAIEAFSTEAERDSVMNALKSGGTPAVKDLLAKMRDRGVLEVGERRAPIKYAGTRPVGSGRIVTVLTAEPLLHMGSGLPDAKPSAGYDVAVALLVLDANSEGHGELAPAAKVKTNESGAVVIEDYGAAKVWLKGVAKAK